MPGSFLAEQVLARFQQSLSGQWCGANVPPDRYSFSDRIFCFRCQSRKGETNREGESNAATKQRDAACRACTPGVRAVDKSEPLWSCKRLAHIKIVPPSGSAPIGWTTMIETNCAPLISAIVLTASRRQPACAPKCLPEALYPPQLWRDSNGSRTAKVIDLTPAGIACLVNRRTRL